MIPRRLPEYVEQGGRQVYRPPYVARSAKLQAFAFQGSVVAIDDLLDRDLNEPAGGEVHYRCANGTVFLVYADIPVLTSVDAPDANYGYTSEKELSIWCLAADLSGAPGGARADRLVWYLPYVFTDSGQAIATGREVYGYTKQYAIVTEGTNPWSVLTQAVGIESFAPGTAAALLPMITITEPGAPTRPPRAQYTGDYETLFNQVVPGALEVSERLGLGGPARPSATLTIGGAPPPPPTDRGGAWLRPSVQRSPLHTLSRIDAVTRLIADPWVVFLKQFRDAECPTKACYQAIVEAPLRVDDVASIEAVNATNIVIEIAQYDSHPLARELLGDARTQSVPCTAAFAATIDFTIMLGAEVWRAPT